MNTTINPTSERGKEVAAVLSHEPSDRKAAKTLGVKVQTARQYRYALAKAGALTNGHVNGDNAAVTEGIAGLRNALWIEYKRVESERDLCQAQLDRLAEAIAALT